MRGLTPLECFITQRTSRLLTLCMLQINSEDSFEQLKFASESFQLATTASVADENLKTAANLLISKRALAETDDVRDSVLYSTDDSPAGVLSLAPEIALLSPPRELARWQSQGQVSNLSSSLVEDWRVEAKGLGAFWSFWDNPVYVENRGQMFWDAARRVWINWDALRYPLNGTLLFVSSFPPLATPASPAGSLTFTFWSRSLWPKNQTGFRIVVTDSSGRSVLLISTICHSYSCLGPHCFLC